MTSIHQITVVGAGDMGTGIAEVVAASGLAVTLVDIAEARVAAALRRITDQLDRAVARGVLEEDAARDTIARVKSTTDLAEAAAGADYVIEAVTEDFSVKSEVLRTLDQHAPPHAILATNTSQFSISSLAACTGRPDRVIGTHWFNPPTKMRLIEVVRGLATSDGTLAETLTLATLFGKETIVCAKDSQGFVTSRLIIALALEAMRVVDEGVADASDVNRACMLAFNHAMGPLDTVDLSGLDTVLLVSERLTEHYGDRFRAPQNIRALVNAGCLGRKSGGGFDSLSGRGTKQ